jgi:DNA-directed RNA polymerase subunit E'/Rpb7
MCNTAILKCTDLNFNVQITTMDINIHSDAFQKFLQMPNGKSNWRLEYKREVDIIEVVRTGYDLK